MRARASRSGPRCCCRAAAAPIRILEKRGDLWVVELPEPALGFFERYGQMPLPPYIRREPDAADVTRYQSVFARKHGAVAAPTASLHFDARAAGGARGARRAARVRHAARGRGHLPAGAHRCRRRACDARRVRRSERRAWSRRSTAARARGARVIAVGTTVVRALESAAGGGELAPYVGDSSLFIVPGFRFRVVDAMLTNFHLPESTLLMLVQCLRRPRGGARRPTGTRSRAVPVFQLW